MVSFNPLGAKSATTNPDFLDQLHLLQFEVTMTMTELNHYVMCDSFQKKIEDELTITNHLYCKVNSNWPRILCLNSVNEKIKQH